MTLRKMTNYGDCVNVRLNVPACGTSEWDHWDWQRNRPDQHCASSNSACHRRTAPSTCHSSGVDRTLPEQILIYF